MAFDIVKTGTLLSIAQEVGVATGFNAAITTAAGSTDPAVLQIVKAINDGMADMIGEAVWPDFIVQHTISVEALAPGQEERGYDLPDDFFKFIDRTQNDKTALWPDYNSVSAMNWQALQTIAIGVTIQLMWRYKDGQLFFLRPPAAGSPHIFQFEYLSQAYVIDEDGDTMKNRATHDGDVILFDPFLVEKYAVAKWKEMKGFDNTAAMAAYQRAFDQRFNRQQAGDTISMVGRNGPWPALHLIGGGNLPQTGYGA